MTGTLFVVGTPIGNLGDLSPRALETLAAVDVIAAEDTRRTGKLLARADAVARSLVSFFEGNERERTEELVARLQGGESVALVVDSGMPSISDPGFRLVRACVDAGIDVRVVPGPSAALAALVVSGLPTDRFVFEGFWPRKTGERRRRLAELVGDPRTLVAFESPRRVRAMLDDALEVLGDRPAALARELTKLHEEVLRGTLAEIRAQLGDADPKGEVVVVIGGAREPASRAVADLVAEVRERIAAGDRPRDAARAVASLHHVSANELYRATLEEP